jgi:cytochrome oxidase assembly protein ShyY1
MKLQTNIFYISLLELAPKDVKLATDVKAGDEEEEWDVEEVLNSRIINRQLQYLIKWLDFSLENNL